MKPCLILAGPSAVGKTTVMNRLMASGEAFVFLRSMTTRPARFVGDDEYLYVGEEAFDAALKNGELLEHATYGNYRYGTPVSEWRRAVSENKIPLLILDRTGVRSVKSHADVPSFAVYMYEDLNVMEQRLYDRDLAKNPSADALLSFLRRKETNVRDYLTLGADADVFDLFVRNEDIEKTAEIIRRHFVDFCRGTFSFSREEKETVLRALRKSAEEKERPLL